VFFRISGGLFNPAVTLALTLIGCLTYTRAAVVAIAQIVGAITSAGIVKVLFPEVRLVPNLAQQRQTDRLTLFVLTEIHCGNDIGRRHKPRARTLH
jgi:aquaporin related protein